jgi:hypothetical protein
VGESSVVSAELVAKAGGARWRSFARINYAVGKSAYISELDANGIQLVDQIHCWRSSMGPVYQFPLFLWLFLDSYL